MTDSDLLPRILIIDDLFGRTHPDRRNEERARLCGSQYRLEDITGDETGKSSLRVRHPIAQAVFHRGQAPRCSVVGDTVENDLEGTLQVVREGWDNPNKPRWALVLLDLCFYTGRVTEESSRRALGMPEGRESDSDPKNYFGLQILEAIQREFLDLPVAILSSKSRNEISREFTRKGALAFIARGDDGGPNLLNEYLSRHGLIPDDLGEIVGRSKAVLLALRSARRAARGSGNILIRGERGTGKELLARYIARQSGRPGGLVTVNSAVFTEGLFASELFGIEGRTATGVGARPGLIEAADRGGLFLDEIKDMPGQVQAAILRVIEEREIVSVGGRQPRPVDVRFLSATNIDIEALATTDKFRFDLLDRLRAGGTIYLPPLRERLEDIPLLVDKFVRDAERDYPGAMEREVEPDALEKLASYDWPGNVRELRNYIYKAVADYPDVEHLMALHLPLLTTDRPRRVETRPPEEGNREVVAPEGTTDVNSLNELIQAMEDFDFESIKTTELAGRLETLRNAYAKVLARYLMAALNATRKRTPDNPDGEIMISPAVKLMTGDKSLRTPKAADIVKQILRAYPGSNGPDNPVLRQVYDYALSLRPKRANKLERS